MLLALYIFFEILVVILFATSFFTKQELLWGLTTIFSGILMFTSYNIQHYIYEYNATIGAYSPVMMSYSYPYLVAINLIFFSLGIILGLFDMFDKYGSRFAGKNDSP